MLETILFLIKVLGFCFLALIGLIIYKFFIGNFIEAFTARLKYGKKVKVIYAPALGMLKLIKNSTRENKHPYKFVEKDCDSDKNLQAYLACGIAGKAQWIILDPQLQKQVVQNIDLYWKTLDSVFNFQYISGSSMFFSDGKVWKKQRLMVAEAFHFQALRHNTPNINQITLQQIQDIKNNQPNNIVRICSVIAGQSFSSSFLGEDFNTQTIEGMPIIDFMQYTFGDTFFVSKDLGTVIKTLISTKYAHYDFLLNSKEKRIKEKQIKIQEFCTEYVKEYIKKNSGNNEKKILLDILIENYHKKETTISQIVKNFSTFFIAAIDTTGLYSALTFYKLSEDQKLQQRIYNDILQYFQSTRQNFDPKSEFEIKHEDLNQIESLNNFIKEGFRFYSPLQNLLIRQVQKDHKLGDFEIKKGQLLNIYNTGNYRSKQYFDNPKKFDIDRWNNKKILEKEPFAYIPFSAGPRNCIGQHLSVIEVKVMIIQIILKYQLIKNPERELVIESRLVMEPTHQDLIIFKSR